MFGAFQLLINLTHIFNEKSQKIVCKFNKDFVSLEHYKKGIQQQLKPCGV